MGQGLPRARQCLFCSDAGSSLSAGMGSPSSQPSRRNLFRSSVLSSCSSSQRALLIMDRTRFRKMPAVRIICGRRVGPIKMRPTTRISSSSEAPMSNRVHRLYLSSLVSDLRSFLSVSSRSDEPMACRNPRTADPRSPPRPRSFLVPKIKATTSRMMMSSIQPKLLNTRFSEFASITVYFLHSLVAGTELRL